MHDTPQQISERFTIETEAVHVNAHQPHGVTAQAFSARLRLDFVTGRQGCSVHTDVRR